MLKGQEVDIKVETAIDMIRPRRHITGISAVLLPFTEAGEVDWDGLANHITRTAEAGLVPAVNMDTGYANFIDEATRTAVLLRTQAIMGDRFFVAGAFVADQLGSAFDLEAYCQQVNRIQTYGGTPIIFQSYGLVNQSPADIVASYQALAAYTSTFIAF